MTEIAAYDISIAGSHCILKYGSTRNSPKIDIDGLPKVNTGGL